MPAGELSAITEVDILSQHTRIPIAGGQYRRRPPNTGRAIEVRNTVQRIAPLLVNREMRVQHQRLCPGQR